MSKQFSKVLPKSRSRSPLNKISTNIEGESPFRSTQKTVSLKRLQGSQVDSFIKKLQSNRENLCTCFEIFQLLYQNEVPQRCIVHNDFVTLYCQDDQKLICVNCMFAQGNHSKHRINPIKSSFHNIIEDNRVNEKRLKQAVAMLTNLHQKSHKVSSQCKSGLENTLRELNEQYQTIQKILVEKYQIARQSIIQKYSQLSSKYKVLQKQLSWLKDTYSQRQANLPRSQQESSQIYQHVLLNTLLQPQKIDLKMIETFNNLELKNQLLGEITRIRNYVETGRQSKDRNRIF